MIGSSDVSYSEDARLREPSGGFGLVQPGGTNFRATDLAPGAVTPMHRTSSIDYNILSECRKNDGQVSLFDAILC